MVYFCDNETADGVEFPAFPRVLAPTADGGPIVVADMSSNILSRRVPVRNFAVLWLTEFHRVRSWPGVQEAPRHLPR